MKIFLSIYSLEVGGAQTFVIRLANELRKRHSVSIFIHNQDRIESGLLKQISADVSVYFLNFSKVINWLAWKANRAVSIFIKGIYIHRLLSEWYFRLVLWSIKPDVINSHMIGADRIVMKYAKKYPWVISMHGCYENELKIDENSRVELNSILDCATSLIYAADKNIELFQDLNLPDNRRKIYYGLKPTKLNDKEKFKAAFVFGMVARSISSKGWEQALKAFELLMQKYPEHSIEFWAIFDHSAYSAALQHKFIHSNIKWIGFQEEPIKYIINMDVCLLPSYFPGESLPNSVIEYLSAGKPVIVSDIGEIKQMISYNNEQAGYIIPIEPSGEVSIGDVLKCMENYILNRELLNLHGTLSAKAFDKFSIEKNTNEYVNFYQISINKYRKK